MGHLVIACAIQTRHRQWIASAFASCCVRDSCTFCLRYLLLAQAQDEDIKEVQGVIDSIGSIDAARMIDGFVHEVHAATGSERR